MRHRLVLDDVKPDSPPFSRFMHISAEEHCFLEAARRGYDLWQQLKRAFRQCCALGSVTHRQGPTALDTLAWTIRPENAYRRLQDHARLHGHATVGSSPAGSAAAESASGGQPFAPPTPLTPPSLVHTESAIMETVMPLSEMRPESVQTPSSPLFHGPTSGSETSTPILARGAKRGTASRDLPPPSSTSASDANLYNA